MVRIPADNEIRKLFRNFTEDFEICDDAGNVLARVQRTTPWSDPDQWEPMTPEISQEEIERRLATPGPTFTTAQVLEQLSKL